MRINSLGREYIHVPVSTIDAFDPTLDPVAFAFVDRATGGVPAPEDFVSGSWLTVDGIYYARCLIGVGGDVTLATGWYDVYVRITDAPEVPVRKLPDRLNVV